MIRSLIAPAKCLGCLWEVILHIQNAVWQFSEPFSGINIPLRFLASSPLLRQRVQLCWDISFLKRYVKVFCLFIRDQTNSEQTCKKLKRPCHSRMPSANDHNFPGGTHEERPQAVLGTVNTRKAPLKSVLSPPIISLLSSTTAMCLVSEMLFAL